METVSLIVGVVVLSGVAAFLFWRYVWFFRSPPRTIPQAESIVSPADGTIVYVKAVLPHEEVLVIKQGLAASVNDIVREDMEAPKILIGIFMSPFNVHYNRAPIAGRVERITHYPAKTANVNMGPMHIRTLFNRSPFYENSFHIVENERTVTRIKGRFKGSEISCYVIQIAGKSVSGIDSYIPEDGDVGKGEIFGMIRIGSQVDVVVPQMSGMTVKVEPGDRVRAGESVLAE
ncbi:MAG TPA: phosphatidylserine decarboxylase [Desulfomonilaceae bacterium]|nr:phosphatidylserine decarboxylase [Desulfomonilaceae bacterium]